MKEYIKPELLKGTRDYFPLDMAKRNFVQNKIVSVFKKFGYDQIQTPAIEYSKTILGKYGEEGEKLIYKFKDNGNRDIALRYDQTVPFSRFISANFKSLPLPFKRYQIGNVWRADRPAKGRYREFTQCDFDIIGTDSIIAEVEIVKIITTVFRELKFKNFIIKFNSRKFLDSLISDFTTDSDLKNNIIRVLDKLDKIGFEGIKKELETFLSIEFTKEMLEKFMAFLYLLTSKDGTKDEMAFNEKLELLKNYNILEIKEFLEFAKKFNIPDENLEFSPSLARGLDYYTGLIFEVFISDLDLGALCSGGRYDNLCELFVKENLTGVGAAFGFERIILAMEELNMLEKIKLNTLVLIANFDKNNLDDSISIYNDLIENGINTELYLEESSLKKQLKYANKKDIPFVLFYGEEEKKNEEIKIKFMETGKEKIIPVSQISVYLKSFYE